MVNAVCLFVPISKSIFSCSFLLTESYFPFVVFLLNVYLSTFLKIGEYLNWILFLFLHFLKALNELFVCHFSVLYVYSLLACTSYLLWPSLFYFSLAFYNMILSLQGILNCIYVGCGITLHKTLNILLYRLMFLWTQPWIWGMFWLWFSLFVKDFLSFLLLILSLLLDHLSSSLALCHFC